MFFFLPENRLVTYNKFLSLLLQPSFPKVEEETSIKSSSCILLELL